MVTGIQDDLFKYRSKPLAPVLMWFLATVMILLIITAVSDGKATFERVIAVAVASVCGILLFVIRNREGKTIFETYLQFNVIGWYLLLGKDYKTGELIFHYCYSKPVPPDRGLWVCIPLGGWFNCSRVFDGDHDYIFDVLPKFKIDPMPANNQHYCFTDKIAGDKVRLRAWIIYDLAELIIKRKLNQEDISFVLQTWIDVRETQLRRCLALESLRDTLKTRYDRLVALVAESIETIGKSSRLPDSADAMALRRRMAGVLAECVDKDHNGRPRFIQISGEAAVKRRRAKAGR